VRRCSPCSQDDSRPAGRRAVARPGARRLGVATPRTALRKAPCAADGRARWRAGADRAAARARAGKGAQSAPAWPGRRGPGRPHPVRVPVEGEQVLVVLLLRAAAGRQGARPGQAALDAVLLDPAERTRAWARPRHARRAGSAVARRAVRRERGESPPAQGGAPCFCRGDRGAGPCFRGGAPARGNLAASNHGAWLCARLREAAATRASSAAQLLRMQARALLRLLPPSRSAAQKKGPHFSRYSATGNTVRTRAGRSSYCLLLRIARLIHSSVAIGPQAAWPWSGLLPQLRYTALLDILTGQRPHSVTVRL